MSVTKKFILEPNGERGEVVPHSSSAAVRKVEGPCEVDQ